VTRSPTYAVTVSDSGTGHYSQVITAGRHVLIADEPASYGGQDLGPSAYEYLLAGLGACTAVTVRMYAERHAWALRRTTVGLQHRKIPDSGGLSTIDHFQRHIQLEGDLTEEQKLRLIQIALKCPVSETLRHSAIVDAELVSDSPATRPRP
jgi:putative redox protein